MKAHSISNKSVIAAAAILVIAGQIRGQDPEKQRQNPEKQVTVTVRPAQTVEQRVADEIKANELRKAAEEKKAAEEAARLAELSPKMLLARSKILFIQSDTEFFDSVQLQNELRKRDEFEAWRLAIVDGSERINVADTIIEIDRPLFTFTFTYRMTNRSTGIILAAGKVTAFDSNVAAPKLASRIVEDIRKARGESKPRK